VDRRPVLVYTNGLADIVYWHGWQGETHFKLSLQKKKSDAEWILQKG
jgi:hypothetical protein